MEYTKEDGDEKWEGEANLSEVIRVLQELKDKHGDIPVKSAYDGFWNYPAEVNFLKKPKPHVIIGTLS